MKVLLSVLKLLILACIVIVLPVYAYLGYPEFFSQFRTMEGVNAYLDQYQTAGIFVYLGLQVLQIIISIIPGQFIQFAGGYAYGFWLGYLLSIAGLALGTTIAFGLARVLGREGVHLVFGEERISRFINQLNSKRAFAILFVIFAVPGLPKDPVIYAAGVSDYGYKSFLLLSLTARTPALMGTLIMGSMLNKGSYFGLITISVLAVFLCIVLFLKRHDLTSYIDRIYKRLMKI